MNEETYEIGLAQKELVAKAAEQLSNLEGGRFNDRQLHNLLARYPPEVSIPLALNELLQRFATMK